MKNKTFAVIGLDRFGSNLAINLQKMGHEVIGIDSNEERVRHIADEITHAAIGDPTDEDVLTALGIADADVAVVSLTDDIQSGVLVTLMLKEMGMSNVIAECTSEIHGRILEKVGADRVIYPEKDMGERLAKNLSNTDIMDYIDLSDEYSIMEIKMPHKWAGKSLAELKIRANYNINIIAFRTIDGTIKISPDPYEPLNAEDAIIVIAPNKSIEQITKE